MAQKNGDAAARRGAQRDDLTAEPLDAEAFRAALGSWFRQHARDLPWRNISHPYATWLSEIMLQQTRVATVIDRYEHFLRRFPTIKALAEADEDAVLALWSGLGYYRRARMLHRGAQFVQRELRGQLPRTAAELRRLPGVGEYTAAAIASIAFGESIAVLDGNVERVLFRILGLPEQKNAAARALLLRTANELVPPTPKRRGRSNPAVDHNQARMERGATICLPKGPLCLQCPVLDFCKTRGEHRTMARKQLRSRRIACLLATRKRGTRTEVMLERRSQKASLMPGMLELPALPLEAVEGREPILRLRHSITNTNYYVEIYAEASRGGPLPADEVDLFDEGMGAEFSPPLPVGTAADEDPEAFNEDEAVFTASPEELSRPFSLRAQLVVNEDDLRWVAMPNLLGLPLTGLARKTLQRLGLMNMLNVKVGEGRTV